MKNVQKVLDAETWACQNGLTDRRNSDDRQQNQAKKRLTRNQSCAKLASLNETRRQAANQAKKDAVAELVIKLKAAKTVV